MTLGSQLWRWVAQFWSFEIQEIRKPGRSSRARRTGALGRAVAEALDPRTLFSTTPVADPPPTVTAPTQAILALRPSPAGRTYHGPKTGITPWHGFAHPLSNVLIPSSAATGYGLTVFTSSGGTDASATTPSAPASPTMMSGMASPMSPSSTPVITALSLNDGYGQAQQAVVSTGDASFTPSIWLHNQDGNERLIVSIEGYGADLSNLANDGITWSLTAGNGEQIDGGDFTSFNTFGHMFTATVATTLGAGVGGTVSVGFNGDTVFQGNVAGNVAATASQSLSLSAMALTDQADEGNFVATRGGVQLLYPQDQGNLTANVRIDTEGFIGYGAAGTTGLSNLGWEITDANGTPVAHGLFPNGQVDYGQFIASAGYQTMQGAGELHVYVGFGDSTGDLLTEGSQVAFEEDVYIGQVPVLNSITASGDSESATNPSDKLLVVPGGTDVNVSADFSGNGADVLWTASNGEGGNFAEEPANLGTIPAGAVWTVTASVEGSSTTRTIQIWAPSTPTPGNGPNDCGCDGNGNGSGQVGPQISGHPGETGGGGLGGWAGTGLKFSGTSVGGGGSPPEATFAPVNYFDGTVVLNSDDLSGAINWGQTRSWAGRSDLTGNNINGNHWDITQLPTLKVINSSVQIILQGSNALNFTNFGNGYVSDSTYPGTLVEYNPGSSSDRFVWTSPSGQMTTFFGGSSGIPASEQGQFISQVDAGGGNAITASYSTGSNPQLLSVQGSLALTSASGTVTSYEQYVYKYYSSTNAATGADSGKLSEVDLERSPDNLNDFTIVQSANYTYYTGSGSGTDTYGNAGDLQSATLYSYDQNGANPQLVSQVYYRYYTSSGVNQGALEYYVDDAGLRALAAASLNPLTTNVSDTALAAYASNYFTYDSTGRVLSEIAAGFGNSGAGQGTFSFVSASSTNPLDYNSWSTVSTVTNPDGTIDKVYTDGFGLTMLTDHSDSTGAHHWINYYRYDAQGNEILHVDPSGISSYNASSYVDLVNFAGGGYLSASSGLFEWSDYGTSTTASTSSPGDVKGYFKDSADSQGLNGAKHYLNLVSYLENDTSTVDGVLPGGTFVVEATNTDFAQDTISLSPTAPGARTTTYAFTYYSGTDRIQQETVSSPVVSAGQNGPGSADVTTTIFDRYGNTIATQDGDGFINYYQYNSVTGDLIQSVQDVNTSANSYPGIPSTWHTPSNGGLNLITNYTTQTTASGSVTITEDPQQNYSISIQDDVHHASYDFSGLTAGLDSSLSGTITSTTPFSMTRDDLTYSGGTYSESLTFSGTVVIQHGQVMVGFNSSNANLLNLGTTTYGTLTLQSLSRTLSNGAGQVVESDAYWKIDNSTYLGTSGSSAYSGALNTNYYATSYGYDSAGRQVHTISPTGTITDVLYDAAGREATIYVGTNDSLSSGGWQGFLSQVAANPSNVSGTNMTLVSANEYDGGGIGNGSALTAGDSNLTDTIVYPGGGQAAQTTQYMYNWRDQQVTMISGVGASAATHAPATVGILDNLGELLGVYGYDNAAFNSGSGISSTDTNANGIPDALEVTSGGLPTGAMLTNTGLAAATTANYDAQGRAYQTSTYNVSPSTGTFSTASSAVMIDESWFDHRGDTIATYASGGVMTKSVYDGAGRVTAIYTTDGGAVGNTPNPGTILSDWSDAGTVANDIVFEQTSYTYDADGNVILTAVKQRFDSATGTGALGGPTGSEPQARVSYSFSYYDSANRVTESVDVGTNGGVLDASANGVDLNSLNNGVATRPSTQPANGSTTVLVTNYTYNAAGQLETICDPRAIVSKTYYDNLGRTTETIADYVTGTPSASSDQTTTYAYDGDGHMVSETAVMPSGTPSQTTQYDYGVSGTVINSSDLLAMVQYPNPSTGAASTSSAQQETYSYDALGEVLTKTDRNGAVHSYTYDALDRQISDTVTIPSGNPQSVDTSVLRIDTSYNNQGLVNTVTSFNNADGASGHIVNQVQNGYNGFGQLTQQWQEHNGAVNGSTLAVQYAYSSAAQGSRMVSMTYPNGNVLNYNYGSSSTDPNNVISRLESLSENDVTLESYKYLGLGTVVERDQSQVGTKLTYISSTAGGDGGDIYTGLDRFGRVADQKWTNSSGVADEYTYAYDANSNVLSKTNALSSGLSETYTYDNLDRLTGVSGGNSQSYTMDALGNISSATINGTQTSRTSNSLDQLVTSGSNTLTYDNNGDMTTDDQGHNLAYDAWGRLVKVSSGTTVLQNFTYDGAGRLITIADASGNRTDSYFSGTQDIETRAGATASSTVLADNVFSPVYTNAILLRDTSGGATRVYFTSDANYDVTAVIAATGSSAGNVVQRQTYSAYGQVTFRNTDWSAITNNADGYGLMRLYQGMLYNAAIGWYFSGQSNVGRWYSPTATVWDRPDSAGYINGLNPNAFVAANPNKYTDPRGLEADEDPAEEERAREESENNCGCEGLQDATPAETRERDAEGKDRDVRDKLSSVWGTPAETEAQFKKALDDTTDPYEKWQIQRALDDFNRQMAARAEAQENAKWWADVQDSWNRMEQARQEQQKLIGLIYSGRLYSYNPGFGADGPNYILVDPQTIDDAEAARDALGREMRRESATYTAGFKDGKIAAGRSGNPAGCAEDDVKRQLGSGVKFTKAMGWRRNDETNQVEWTEIPVCRTCQGMYTPDQFPYDVQYNGGGIWDQYQY